ncbi:MAG: CxxC-x17-CxxC domain-containing protein [bacterium]
MKNFNRGGRQGGGGNRFGGGRDFNRGDRGGRDFGRPSMHKAICDECGNECEVPFRPTGDKPIYCSNCFQGKRDGGSSKFGKSDFRKSSFEDKKRYTVVCSKCGKSCEVPFRPAEGKPVYCDECFGKGGSTAHKETGNSNEQFNILSAKLDKIIKLLTPANSAEAAPKTKEAIKEVKTSQPEKPSKKIAAKKPIEKKVAAKEVVAKKVTDKKIVEKKAPEKKKK